MDQKNYKPVPVLSSGDLSAGATLAGDSINMAKCHSARFIVIFHALGGAATYVKLYSGATAAAATSALTFRYAFGGAATGSANADKTSNLGDQCEPVCGPRHLRQLHVGYRH
jgi:hypothetical protein